MSQKSRIITLSVLAVLIVVCVVLGVTYSFMQANIDSNSVTEVSLSSCAKITLEDGGDSISIENSYPVSRNKGIQTEPYTFTVTSDCESYVGFNMYLATFDTNTLSDSSIHYVITEHDSKETLVEGILRDAPNALGEFSADDQNQLNIGLGGTFGTIYKLYNDDIPLQGSVTYDLYLWVDESVTNDTMNQEFRAGVAIKSYDREILLTDACSIGDNLASCIKEFNILAGDGSNGLYYHDGQGTYINASEEAGDNSYRYSGSNPNNFVCFGSDSVECENDNLYRIIGVFGNEVKLIKYDYTTSNMLGTNSVDYYGPYSDDIENYLGYMDTGTIAAYSWNSIIDSGANSWATSQLNTINLNVNYVNNLGEWANLIDENDWYIGGVDFSLGTAKTFYDVESESITYNAKIGLLYVSDYGYGASPDSWTVSLNDFNIKNNNWLYMGLYEWMITPYSSTQANVFRISGLGYAVNSNSTANFAVRPCFYLNYDVEYISGDGSKNNPIRIN